MQQLKFVVIGDGLVGKDFLCTVYQDFKLPEKFLPAVFNIYEVTKEINNSKTQMEIW